MPDRRTVIITFKPKDERSTSDDKQEIFRAAISPEVSFFTAEDFSRGPSPVPSGQDMEALGYDVNRYEAPILMANLTDKEIAYFRYTAGYYVKLATTYLDDQ